MLPQKLINSHMREKIELMVKNAIENKPNGCKNIQIIEKREYIESSAPFSNGHYETNSFARYTTNKGEEEIKIDKMGDWMYSDPANYILEQIGEYHPKYKQFGRENQKRYEGYLDSGMIDKPINNIISPKWQIKKICEEIIVKSVKNVKFTLWFDKNELNKEKFDTTEHWYYSDDLKIKQYFCAKITIKYGNKTHTTRGGFYSEYISWINKCANALKNHNINYTVDITDKDYQKWCKFHSWNDLEFEDFRFKL